MSLEKRLDRLITWLRGSDHFYLSDRVEVNECEESGRGVILKDGILRKNDKVITVPSDYQLNFNSILWNISIFNPGLNVRGVTVSECERLIKREQLNQNDPRFRIYAALDQETLMSLTSFQLFALFILIERELLPLWSNGTIESFWQPFFDVWPSWEELGSIPAIWSSSNSSKDKNLIAFLPLASQKLLQKKIDLLKCDWSIIEPWLLSSCEKLGQDGLPCPSTEDLYGKFLHIYFIINSRCLYSKVHLKDNDTESQFTMVPFVDFLNHTDEVDLHCYPKITRDPKDKIKVGAFSLRCGEHFYSTKGEEIFLNYGPHSNDFLLNEYGFVLQENRWNFIDISNEVKDMIGDDPVMVSFLKDQGYWDNYTVNQTEISYRALVAISLIVTQDYRRIKKLLAGFISEDYFLPRISDRLRQLLEEIFNNYQERLQLLADQSAGSACFSVKNLATIYEGYLDIIEHHLDNLL